MGATIAAHDTAAVTGRVVIDVRGPDGHLKHRVTARNLITDAGDAYHAGRIAAGVAPANAAAPTDLVNGMKFGTGSTAAAKNGAGAALGAYLPGSNVAFDAGTPTLDDLGPGNGVNVTYSATWPPGVATHAALSEIVIVTDADADATSGAGATIARLVFPSVSKAAADTATAVWSHRQRGGA